MAELVYIAGCPHDPTLASAKAAGTEAHPDHQLMVAEFERLRADLAASTPDCLVVVGGDHLNQWFLDNMPAFSVGKAPRVSGPFPDERRAWNLPAVDVPCDQDLARLILSGGLERGFDLARSDEFLVDHAFTIPLDFLRPEQDLPTVVVFTNILAPPLASAQRFFDLGVALREIIESWEEDKRVAVIVTGHLTNNVGGPRFLDFMDDPLSDWDRRTWNLIEQWDLERLIEESTYDNLYAAGTSTPAFLDYILGFGVARGKPPKTKSMIGAAISPPAAFFDWDLATLGGQSS